MQLTKLSQEATLSLLKAGHFHGERFVLMEYPEGLKVEFHTTRDGAGSIFGLDAEQAEVIVDTMTNRTLDMVNDMHRVVTEQNAACDRLEADGKQGNRPEFSSVDEISIYGIVYGGFYSGVNPHHVGEDTPVQSKAQYTQMVTFSAYAMDVNGKPVDFHTMAAMCMSYGIPVCPCLEFGTFEDCIQYHGVHRDQLTVIPSAAPLLNGECEPVLLDGKLQGLPFLDDNIRYGHLLRVVAPTETCYELFF